MPRYVCYAERRGAWLKKEVSSPRETRMTGVVRYLRSWSMTVRANLQVFVGSASEYVACSLYSALQSNQ